MTSWINYIEVLGTDSELKDLCKGLPKDMYNNLVLYKYKTVFDNIDLIDRNLLSVETL